MIQIKIIFREVKSSINKLQFTRLLFILIKNINI